MLVMQLQRENFVYEREKDKRESKEVADKASLQAKNAQTMLMHSLHKKLKDADVLCQEITKKQNYVEVSRNIGTITALLRSKQMDINGQFNAHLSLDAVSFCFLKYSSLNFVTHTHSNFILQCYATLLIGPNAVMQMQVQPMQHQYP
jgi:hypothetical protein